MKVPEEEDQPDPLEREVPERILPDQVAADIKQALHEDAEGRVGYGPEPLLGYAQDLLLRALGQGVVVDDAEEGEHEHDLDVPSHHGAERGIARGGPEGGALGKMHDPAVPGLVEEVHAEDGGPGKNRIPVPGLFRQLDLFDVDVKDDRQERDGVPLDQGEVPEPVQCLQGRLSHKNLLYGSHLIHNSRHDPIALIYHYTIKKGNVKKIILPIYKRR